jgi:hypothetical protein
MDAETMEALACREAVALGRDLNLQSVRVATGCKNVVKSLQEGTMDMYAHIIQEINLARSEFREVTFCHERRSSNKEAHTLARSMVNKEQGRSVWFLNPSDGLCTLVEKGH